jgi:hypothetical protein
VVTRLAALVLIAASASCGAAQVATSTQTSSPAASGTLTANQEVRNTFLGIALGFTDDNAFERIGDCPSRSPSARNGMLEVTVGIGTTVVRDATVTVLTVPNRKVAAQVRTDVSGSVVLEIPAGRYVLSATIAGRPPLEAAVDSEIGKCYAYIAKFKQ